MKPFLLYFLQLSLVSVLIFPSSFAQTSEPLPLRLRVGTYNVGHFNQGRLGGFQGEGRIVESDLNRWRKWIGEQSLDLFGVNEWNRYFDKDSTFQAKEELLDSYYKHVYLGTENTWIYNGFAANFELYNIREEVWAGEYYAIIGELRVQDKTIHVISTHLPWQKEWHDQSVRDLIQLLGGYEYFICLGDMNARDENQRLFTEAGFNMANGGAMGWFPTNANRTASSGYMGKEDVNIDNIVTSPNIKIMNVRVPQTGLNDLDHFPVMADLIITW